MHLQSKKRDNKAADYEAENIEADTHRRVNVFRLMGRYFILYVLSLPSPVYAYNLYHVALKADGWRFSVSIAVCYGYGIFCDRFHIMSVQQHTADVL